MGLLPLISTLAVSVRPAGARLGRRHNAGHGGRPGRHHGRQAAGGHPHGGHDFLQGLGEGGVGRQRRHLVLPEIDIAPRQIVQIRWLAFR
jgi:hypothetical protein